MSAVVEAGRRAFGPRAWRAAYSYLSAADCDSALAVDDLELLAVAAYLIGSGDSSDLWSRAYKEWLRLGEPARAARCAFWLAYGLLDAGEVSRGGGWLARAHQLVEQCGVDCVEERFVAVSEIADRFGDGDLAAMARMGEGQARIALGAKAGAQCTLRAGGVP